MYNSRVNVSDNFDGWSLCEDGVICKTDGDHLYSGKNYYMVKLEVKYRNNTSYSIAMHFENWKSDWAFWLSDTL